MVIGSSRINMKPHFLKVQQKNRLTLMLFQSGAFVVTGIRKEKLIKPAISRFVKLINSAGKLTDHDFHVATMENHRIKTVLGVAMLPFQSPTPEIIITRWTFDNFAHLQYNVELQTYITIRQTTPTNPTAINLFTRTGRMLVFGKDIPKMRSFVRNLSFLIYGISQ
jgi:TATA-box binding protein (TBP) (component of TFIID and TFIIIB)